MGGRVSRATLALAALLAAGLPATAPAQQAPQADSAAADTLTARQRALRRLRALPASPVQPPPDTLPADSVAVDTLAPPAADTGLVIDTAARATADVDAPVVEDSVVRLLRSLEGYVATDYTAESAVFLADSNRLRLGGRSKVGRAGRELTADSLLVYRGDTGVVCGYGAPVLSGDGEPVTSREVCYDIDRSVGMARGAETKFARGATWYVRGADNRVYLLTGDGDGQGDRMYAEDAEFTSCDLPEPHYTFKGETLKAVDGGMMVARDVTLRFEDVPVFWLPWMVQSTKRGRRSGLLMPQFGVNDIVRNSTGYNRHLSNLGFYWAINDYMSAQVTGDWYSDNYTALEGTFSYRWLRQFLNGNLAVKRYWPASGGGNLAFNTSNSWQPDERTSLSAAGNYTQQLDFVKRNSFDPRELNRQIAFNSSIRRSFGWGSVNAGYSRQQNLADETVQQSFPKASLSLSPITLFAGPAGGGLTWSGGASFDRRSRDVLDTIPGQRDQDVLETRANHSLSWGSLSLSQSIDYDETVQPFRPALAADTALPETAVERLNWSTSLGYQQNLWTGTTLSPRVSLSGQRLANAETGGSLLAAPVRTSFGASLNTSLYGFWPGVGPFSRIRHKVSPSLSWSYSPTPRSVTELQDSVFGLGELREQHTVSLSINQTWEAKYEEADTAAADTTAAAGAAGAAGATGEPRRLPQARKVTILALNTTPSFSFDFVEERERPGFGFTTQRVSNSIRSDLLRGLSISTTHDLFEEIGDEEGALVDRRFDPHLTNLRASFSIDHEFWLWRVLGLTRGAVADTVPTAEREQPAEGVSRSDDTGMVGGEADPEGMAGDVNSIVPNRGPRDDVQRSGIGGWRASLDYTMDRPREGPDAGEGNQMLRGNVSFRPTEHWNLRWSTSYSFTAGEFADHVLTLSRDLHRWQANFDFIKAQNGNFAMQFRVQLIDNPDLKLDYDQRTDPSRVRRSETAQ